MGNVSRAENPPTQFFTGHAFIHLLVDDIGQDVHDLRCSGSSREGSGINFLEGSRQVRIMQCDQAFAEGRGISGVQLAVLTTKISPDDIGLLDQDSGSNRVDLGRLLVPPKRVLFGPEDGWTAVVAGLVLRHWSKNCDGQIGQIIADVTNL